MILVLLVSVLLDIEFMLLMIRCNGRLVFSIVSVLLLMLMMIGLYLCM